MTYRITTRGRDILTTPPRTQWQRERRDGRVQPMAVDNGFDDRLRNGCSLRAACWLGAFFVLALFGPPLVALLWTASGALVVR